MASLRWPCRAIWLALLLFNSIWPGSAKDKPTVHHRKFDNPPIGLQYFDDSETILTLESGVGVIWRSTDAGKNWDKAEGVAKDIGSFWLHPTDNKRAYALGRGHESWVTTDQGKSWDKFELPDKGATPSARRFPLAFHAGNSKKVIVNACTDHFCNQELSYYTTNDFKDVHLLKKDAHGCQFAHGTVEFQPTKKDEDDDRALCIVRGKQSLWTEDNILMVSDDFFKEHAYEPQLDEGRVVRGIISMAVVKGYLVAAAKSEGTQELALYVTVDAEKWHRALLPQEHRIEELSYTILESTNYSIQMDVMTTLPFNPMGVLLTSDSEGKYFTENTRHTNRNYDGVVDFEKIQGIQGIVMVNVVDNWQDLERNARSPKKIRSKISFDDGRTWDDLKVKDSSDKLHVHSVTDMANSGRIFSSPAPGMVMAVGNTGDYLHPYAEGDLFVSDDAGVTWKKALPEAHKYEFGDQGGIVVAISDEGLAEKVSFSLNHGQDWDELDLGDAVSAKILTTVPDSTSRKFVLEAFRRNKKDKSAEYMLYALDFDGLHERKCGDDDFEEWTARKDEDGKASCIMGHTQLYRRRKKDAECFIGKDFEEARPESKECECQHEDFECDFNFAPTGEDKDLKCEPVAPIKSKDSECKDSDDKFMGPSGFRLIPGNKCKGGFNKAKEIERACSETVKAKPASGKIEVEITEFKADRFGQKVYLERSKTSSGSEQDETIVMSTVRDGAVDELWITHDQGKTWKQILEHVDNIKYIVKHEYEHDRVYFLTGSKEVHYSVNRGKNFGTFKVPYRMDDHLDPAPLSFNHDNNDYLIWIGAANCDSTDDEFEERGGCHMVASYSTDRGDNWKTLVRFTEKCEFIRRNDKSSTASDHLIFCETHQEESAKNPLDLQSSENWWANSARKVDNILTFVTMSEFTVVAQKDEKSNLQVKASVDGQTFADARFPPNFNVPHQTAYTVLDSSTNAIFLHVTVGTKANFEYGRIMKSNSNGTSYVLSINAVNRDGAGYVDFEKMQGVEGVALVNVVDNLDDEAAGKKKKLKSMITHNDGGEWAPIKAPEKDDEGKAWDCDIKNAEECSLHLHHYTERDDPRDTFSSPSAIGLLMGVGNVGQFLGSKKDDNTHTFFSPDAGVTWKTVKKGSYMWEYGDQGSIVVIVEESAHTDVLYYTLDEGDNWTKFKFAKDKVKISDLTTVPSDVSTTFVIWASDGRKVMSINVDFTGLREGTCKLDEGSGTDNEGDFYLWKPRHPLQDSDCLFGHVTKYHRKKLDSQCWIGSKFEALHDKDLTQNCTCTRRDFEWYACSSSDHFSIVCMMRTTNPVITTMSSPKITAATSLKASSPSTMPASAKPMPATSHTMRGAASGRSLSAHAGAARRTSSWARCTRAPATASMRTRTVAACRASPSSSSSCCCRSALGSARCGGCCSGCRAISARSVWARVWAAAEERAC